MVDKGTLGDNLWSKSCVFELNKL